MGELGVPELLLIFGIALLLFGPKKIGELGKGLGEGIKSFKSALRGEGESPAGNAKDEPKANTPTA
jgi:sec-independent protein translocase protein TatA